MTITINPTAAKVLAVAEAEVGYHEGRNASGWDNIQKYSEQVPSLKWSDGEPWCAVFVSWVAQQAGCPDLYPCTASVATANDWFRTRGQLSHTPTVGAQFILNGSEHTGFVIAMTPSEITTIEGNSNATGSPQGDGVYKLTRQRSDTRLMYGAPKFPPSRTGVVTPTRTPATDSPGTVFKAEILASCRKALLAIPVRRQVQRAAVVAIRSAARLFPTP